MHKKYVKSGLEFADDGSVRARSIILDSNKINAASITSLSKHQLSAAKMPTLTDVRLLAGSQLDSNKRNNVSPVMNNRSSICQSMMEHQANEMKYIVAASPIPSTKKGRGKDLDSVDSH